jgi:hypothetical protein
MNVATPLVSDLSLLTEKDINWIGALGSFRGVQ